MKKCAEKDRERKLEKPLDNSAKLAVNAALTKLTEGWDEASARIVIQHCHQLPISNRLSVEHYLYRKRDGGVASGHTEDFGDMQIKAGEETTVKESSFGVQKERVGYFKVYRKGLRSIAFHHFWQSDISTQSDIKERPLEYLLGYEFKTLKPLFFGVWEAISHSFSFPFMSATIKIYRFSLNPIHGEVPKGLRKTVVEFIKHKYK